MIVAIQRSDVALDDHFEIPLDPTPGAPEVDDEIEVTYQNTIPGCAFTLALATRIDGVVSDYTPVPLVVDTTLPHPSVITQIFDETGDGNGHTLNDALGLATDPFGAVYVTGAASNNVLRRSDVGVITQILDATGDGIGHNLTYAYAASIRGSDNTFIASHAPAPDTYVFKAGPGSGFEQLMLDSSGDGTHPFSAAGGIAESSDESTIYVSGALSDNVFKVVNLAITQIIDATGDGVHALGEVVDVAVDTASNAYVVGSATNNAFKITPGGVITQIIDSSSTDGAFKEPVAVATAGTDVYVLGGASSRRAFKITPTTTTVIIGPEGDGVHPFELPGDIATDDVGNVSVSDRANRVFQISPGH